MHEVKRLKHNTHTQKQTQRMDDQRQEGKRRQVTQWVTVHRVESQPLSPCQSIRAQSQMSPVEPFRATTQLLSCTDVELKWTLHTRHCVTVCTAHRLYFCAVLQLGGLQVYLLAPNQKLVNSLSWLADKSVSSLTCCQKVDWMETSSWRHATVSGLDGWQ